MPWINEDLCVGCGICVDDCPVGAITLKENQTAVINDDECIRCGRCHDVCPQEAVRHDGERIPEEAAANIEKTKGLLKHFETPREQQAYRALRPGGELLIVGFPRDSLAQRLWNENYYNRSQIASLLRKANFENIQTKLIERRQILWARATKGITSVAQNAGKRSVEPLNEKIIS